MATSNYTPSAELVTILDGKLTTTSLIVAKRFNKRHADVLRALENLECPQGFCHFDAKGQVAMASEWVTALIAP